MRVDRNMASLRRDGYVGKIQVNPKMEKVKFLVVFNVCVFKVTKVDWASQLNMQPVYMREIAIQFLLLKSLISIFKM